MLPKASRSVENRDERLMSKGRIILLSICAGGILVLVLYGIMVAVARPRAYSRQCASAVTSICLAAKMWANDHDGIMPTNFICMSNEVNTPKILSCLASRRASSSSWADFKPENCTYEIMAPGMRADDTNRAFLRCTIHGHLGYSDSTVFDGKRRHTKGE